jgi:hypothetical protein
MTNMLHSLITSLRSGFKSHRELALQNLVLRQRLAVLTRSAKRAKITAADRARWSLHLRWWRIWREALVILKTGDDRRLASQGVSRQPHRQLGFHRLLRGADRYVPPALRTPQVAAMSRRLRPEPWSLSRELVASRKAA